MTIPSFKILKKNAAERVAAAEHAKPLVLILAGTATGLTLLVTLVNYLLGQQISTMGGLSNMGLRTVLATIQSMLPMLQSVVLLCLELGYIAAMLRISRQQYTSPSTLKLGFDRVWVLLRHTIIQGFLYLLVGLAAFWLAMQIYLLTPLSRSLMAMLTEDMIDPDVLMTYLQDPVFSANVTTAMIPMFLIMGILYLVLFLPIHYSLRLSRYVIIDKPGMGAVYAIKESRKMMKGSRMRLFRLDLSLWWWYAALVGAAVLGYGDSLLPLLGITLPFSETAAYYQFYGLYLIAQFAVWYFLRNRVEVVYAQVYNALKPREQNNGVVLGNIFQM